MYILVSFQNTKFSIELNENGSEREGNDETDYRRVHRWLVMK